MGRKGLHLLKRGFQGSLPASSSKGRQGERCYQEGRRWIDIQLAEIVTLDRLGTDQTEFEVSLGSKKPTEHLAYEHVFDPDKAFPPPMF
jgi:hypothetical protein